MSTPLTSCHSADVRAQLLINGHAFDVGQLGPGYLILRNPIDTPPGDAVLTFQIDGNEQTRHLRLTEGIQADRPKTAISAANSNRAAG